jgi:undecaprenyl-diphosphatase
VKQQIEKWIDWIGGHGPVVLIVIGLIVGGTWGFVELADEVIEGETETFDRWAVRAMRQPPDYVTPIGPPWLHEMGRDLTALGGVATLCLVSAGVAGYLVMVRKYHAFWLLVAATTGALVLSMSLKNLFDRERPGDVPHLSIVHTSSFPSGHAMMSTAVYLTLAVLLARLVSQQKLRVYFLALGLFLAFLVGVSRVYMGVHYPTDVLAGWTAGLVWALLCLLVARYLQQHGKIESADETTDTLQQDATAAAGRSPGSSI